MPSILAWLACRDNETHCFIKGMDGSDFATSAVPRAKILCGSYVSLLCPFKGGLFPFVVENFISDFETSILLLLLLLLCSLPYEFGFERGCNLEIRAGLVLRFSLIFSL